MSTPQQFKNRKEAHKFLQKKGHALPYTTFADHCKEKKCKVEADNKTILISSLYEYIESHLAPASGQTDASLSRREKQLDVAIKEENLRKKEITNRESDKEWMKVADHDQQVAALMGVVFDIVAREMDVCMDDIIMVAGVESSRRAEITTVIKERIDAAKLALSTSPEFEVVFGEIEGEEAA